MNSDASRIAILCANCGFFTYAWNGTQYVSEYRFPYALIAHDFSIRSDFKMITLVNTANMVRTILYDNDQRKYV